MVPESGLRETTEIRIDRLSFLPYGGRSQHLGAVKLPELCNENAGHLHIRPGKAGRHQIRHPRRYMLEICLLLFRQLVFSTKCKEDIDDETIAELTSNIQSDR